MRIGVAVVAVQELEAGIAGLSIVAGGVALGAGHGGVFAGQRIAGLGVIERLLVELGALPRGGVVALQAVLAETALMMVFVTGAAGGAEAHPGVVQVLGFEQSPSRGGDVF